MASIITNLCSVIHYIHCIIIFRLGFKMVMRIKVCIILYLIVYTYAQLKEEEGGGGVSGRGVCGFY